MIKTPADRTHPNAARLRPLQAIPGTALWPGLRIGLLGGSFNPAHGGHRHISLEALKRLRLDYVWWLVSPRNPLKPAAGMAPLGERLATARKIANHPRIRVSALEAALGTRYTSETISRLRALLPRTRLVWLTGADNMIQLPRWHNWRQIIEALPIAVFDRPSYSLRVASGTAALRYRHQRLPERRAGRLAGQSAPKWVFLHGSLCRISATEIRQSHARNTVEAAPEPIVKASF